MKVKEKLRLEKKPIAVEEEKELTEIQMALLENNKILQDSITQAVVKEVGFLFQAADRQEEERYKKLDSLIRQQQAYRKESAKMPLRTFRRLFEA